MGVRLLDRWGNESDDPPEEALVAALNELADDEPHLSTWMKHDEVSVGWWDGENDWFIATDPWGNVVFGGILGEEEEVEEYVLPQPVSRDKVLQLWRLLCKGDLEGIRREPWQARTYE